METLTLVTDIVRLSLKFDSDLEEGKYNVLQKTSDEIKTKLQKLKLVSTKAKLNELCEKVYKVNKYSMDYVNSELPKSDSVTDNVLIFFYAEKCKPSKLFVPEWEKMSEKLNGKIRKNIIK